MPNLSVLLLGDAHRLSYQEHVRDLLAEDGLRGQWPAESTGDSAACRAGIEAWIGAFKPDIVCLSCAPHAAEESHHQRARETVSVSDYEADLLRIGDACRRWCGRQVVFVTTPPVHPARFAGAGAQTPADTPAVLDTARSLNRTIKQYNEGAMHLLSQLNIMVVRLCNALEPYLDECIGDDGVSLSPAGVERAARVVATGILGVV